MTKEISDSEFQEEVLNSKKPVLVDFWAPWCGPCKMLSPIIDQLSEELKGTVKIVKINIDNNSESSSQFGVRSIPTLILFKDGKQIDLKTGVHQKNILTEWINTSI